VIQKVGRQEMGSGRRGGDDRVRSQKSKHRNVRAVSPKFYVISDKKTMVRREVGSGEKEASSLWDYKQCMGQCVSVRFHDSACSGSAITGSTSL
jgi:hypothetical protein